MAAARKVSWEPPKPCHRIKWRLDVVRGMLWDFVYSGVCRITPGLFWPRQKAGKLPRVETIATPANLLCSTTSLGVQ